MTLDSAAVEGLWATYVARRDEVTWEKLIVQYVPLVKYVVGRFPLSQSSILSAEDLISHGVIGLVQAIQRFDPTRGVKFETYAIARIRGAIIDGIRSLNATGRAAWQRGREVEQVLATLDAELGRAATDEEAAARMGVDVNTFRDYLSEAGTVTISLDGLLDSSQSDERPYRSIQLKDMDSLGPESEAEEHELRDRLREGLKHLTERDRLLVALYYYEELTMKEISQVLNISESRVCQLHARAVQTLRGYLSNQPAIAGKRS